MRGRLTRLSVVVAIAIATVAPGAAAGAEISMQALLDDDGSGRLFVNDPGTGFAWEVCAVGLRRCDPFKRGREISTAGAPRNSVFRVSRGDSVGTSPVWVGRVKSLTPPSVRGIVRANELVTSLRGRWRGGWKGEDSDTLQLAACDTADGQGCTTLTHSHFVRGCRNGAAVLDPVFVGDYLRVADRRRGAGPIIEPAYAVTTPYGHEILRRNRITSVAYVGRIAPAAGPKTEQCGPPPLAEEPSPDAQRR